MKLSLAYVDFGAASKVLQELPHPLLRHRHAAGRRGEARLGKMQEYRATATGYPGPCVVVDFNNEIIKMVLPAQPVPGCARGHMDRPIIAAVAGVLAPGIGGGDTPNRQQGCGPR